MCSWGGGGKSLKGGFLTVSRCLTEKSRVYGGLGRGLVGGGAGRGPAVKLLGNGGEARIQSDEENIYSRGERLGKKETRGKSPDKQSLCRPC